MLGLVIYYFVTRSAEDCGYLTVSVHLFTRAREREVMLEQKEKEDSQQQHNL